MTAGDTQQEDSHQVARPTGSAATAQHRIRRDAPHTAWGSRIALRAPNPLLLGTGGILLACHLIVATVSSQFGDETDPAARPVLPLVALLSLAGIAFLVVAGHLLHRRFKRADLIWVIGLGLLMRMVLLPSAPVLEDDYYRYLWDGAVASRGISPYAVSPQQVRQAARDAGDIPPALRDLAQEGGAVLDRVNHPWIRTGYPPVAQAAFAMAHQLRPWSIAAWRIILLGVDLVVLVLLLALLRALALPAIWSTIYWWNPLLIKETFNSGHMDLLAVAFVLGAVLLAVRKRYVLSGAVLAIAVGVKIWPIVLLPVLLRPVVREPARWVPAAAVFLVLAGVLVLPVVSGSPTDSAYANYSMRWQNNAAAFQVLLGLAETGHAALGYSPHTVQRTARILTGIVYGAFLLWLVRKPIPNGRNMLDRCLLATAGMFLLSPTGFPWYYVWMVPFLALRPRASLLLLTALLPLYYLRYDLEPRGQIHVFEAWVVWAEFLPVWVLLAWEWYRGAGWAAVRVRA